VILDVHERIATVQCPNVLLLNNDDGEHEGSSVDSEEKSVLETLCSPV